jgi:8-oxo-dGTP diphosphatase
MNRHILLKNFEGFTRIRVGAILIEKNAVLLIKQASLFDTTLSNWLPPGGGLQFRESLEDAVQRECFEETGLKVNPVRLLYINEFIHDQVHAVEFFFLVERQIRKKLF